MKVKVKGLGIVEFPDEMSEDEIKTILSQYDAPKDDTVAKLLGSIEKLLKAQQPTVVTNTEIREIEKTIPVYEPKVVEVERVLPRAQTGWHFKIERDEDGITDIYAEPYE